MALTFAHAHVRFGLGRSPRDTVVADPVSAFAAQLEQPDPGPAGASVADAFGALLQDRMDRQRQGQPGRARQIFRAETQALQDWAITTATPFRERLVAFWANHFTVSLRRGEVAPLAGAYVREAIRPHATGRFSDLLLAVMRHPAMLLYLDNAGSAGPNSQGARRSSR